MATSGIGNKPSRWAVVTTPMAQDRPRCRRRGRWSADAWLSFCRGRCKAASALLHQRDGLCRICTTRLGRLGEEEDIFLEGFVGNE